ncbi:MAG: VOC family protein [Hydrogenophaga sp.]|nr:VOC family protein [Hydrogenophaga sp.]MDP2096943.1 VOC family protein [Hydrogenophaga sp.]
MPIKDIAFVRYQATDLDRMESFLVDFGLHRAHRTPEALYMRAHDASPFVHVTELGSNNQTLGFGLQTSSESDLHEIAAHVGSVVSDNPEPGGGLRVRFSDPNGFLVDALWGQAQGTALPARQPIAMNPAVGRQRMGRTVRLSAKPCEVARIGHAALFVSDFRRSYDFYTRVLGFKPSDTYWAQEESNVVAAFMHCGLGQQWTDHHTIALITARDGRARFAHTAFEVLDLDDLAQGSKYLTSKGHRHSWGIGRHIQGSQLFDYWIDPFGNKIEHWTDGDLVNDDTPVGHAKVGADELSQWSPPMPEDFLK